MNLDFCSHSLIMCRSMRGRVESDSLHRLAKNHSRTTTRVVKHAVYISHRTSNVSVLLVQTQIVAKTYLDDHKLIHLF